jgi:hypothetical protein
MPKTATPTALLLAALLAATALGLAVPLVAAPLAGAQSALSPPASARPGYWADTSCSENGEPASSAGWLPPIASPYPLIDGVSDDCLYTGGSLGLRDEGSKDSTPDTGPAWIYEAPSVDSPIVDGFADLTMQSPGGEATLSVRNGHSEWTTLASCNELCTTLHAATATIPTGEYWTLTAEARCTAPAGKSACTTSGVNAELNITRATLLMRNSSTPEAEAVTGTLTESPVSGTADIAFQASDPKGPGVYRVGIEVDGKEVVSETPNLNEENCVAHGTYDEALNFRNSQPCPQETPVRIEVPTAGIANGPHLVEAILEDAAGHRSVVYDKTIDFQNGPSALAPSQSNGLTSTATSSPPSSPPRGPANGSPVSEVATIGAHWAGTKAAMSATSSYGHARTIVGRLTDPAGTPIVGALIEVSDRPAAIGASASAMASTRTTSDGSFSVRVPASQSETVQLAYRSHLGDPAPAASANLTLAVPARIHLSVNPTVTNVGEQITLHGKLAGAIGAHGKQLILEARVPGGPWLEFHGAKADALGNFKVKHTFKLPGPVRYQFRVICEAEPAFPFARGVSNVVSVWER